MVDSVIPQASSGNPQVERWIRDASIVINQLVEMANGLPGDIRFIADGNVEDGFLLCNAAAVSRTTYSDLFAVIGTTYGAGDGSTTFNLPPADTIPRQIKT